MTVDTSTPGMLCFLSTAVYAVRSAWYLRAVRREEWYTSKRRRVIWDIAFARILTFVIGVTTRIAVQAGPLAHEPPDAVGFWSGPFWFCVTLAYAIVKRADWADGSRRRYLWTIIGGLTLTFYSLIGGTHIVDWSS